MEVQRTGAALSQAGTGAALSQVEEAEGDGGPDGSRWRPGLRPGLRPGPATPWAGAEQTAAVAGPPACPRSLPHQPRPVLGPWPRVCLRLPAEGWLNQGTSLVVQRLQIGLPMQGVWI